MSNLHFKKSKSPKTKSFYVALTICLVAIVATVFTTYDSFVHHNLQKKKSKTQNKPETVQSQSNKETNKDIHGIIIDDKKDVSSTETSEQAVDTNYDDTELETSIKKSHDSEKENPLIVYPCSKEIIKKYSFENPVYSKTMDDWRLHCGVDFKSEQGEKVKAITDGVVKDIYEDPLLGKTIAIEHQNQVTAFYSGLGDTTLVNKDDSVKTGQEIGSVNDIPSEFSDGYHLHFAVKKDGVFINPLDILPQ